ncbi:hypothetical protein K438DRAFT_1788234 [Mycena galopus ATCC 62051]|nr:hypothetical protein K438DRAFT_1788234 [Mycena galopus ATCC 62051]
MSASATTKRASSFTAEQDEYIEGCMSDYCSRRVTSGANESNWKKAKVNEIWESDAFAQTRERATQVALNNHATKGEASEADWKKKINKKFDNHYNNVFLKKKHQTAVASRASTNAKATDIFGGGHYSGLNLFGREREDIKAACTNERGAVDVGRLQRLRKEGWTALTDGKREEYDKRADTELNDVAANQAGFSEMIWGKLDDVARGGRFGDIELLLFYGYRTQEGEVVCGTINAHSGSSPDMETLVSKAEWDRGFGKPWADFVAKTIPAVVPVVRVGTVEFKRDENGVPLFPRLKMSVMTASAIKPVLKTYFELLWAHSAHTTAIPWDDIASNAAGYYDTAVFSFPHALQRPSSMSILQVMALGDYLANRPDTQPALLFFETIKNNGRKDGAGSGEKPKNGAKDGENGMEEGEGSGENPKNGAKDGEDDPQEGAGSGEKPKSDDAKDGAKEGEGGGKKSKKPRAIPKKPENNDKPPAKRVCRSAVSHPVADHLQKESPAVNRAQDGADGTVVKPRGRPKKVIDLTTPSDSGPQTTSKRKSPDDAPKDERPAKQQKTVKAETSVIGRPRRGLQAPEPPATLGGKKVKHWFYPYGVMLPDGTICTRDNDPPSSPLSETD